MATPKGPAMPKIIPLILALALAVAAVLLHLPAMAPVVTPFTRGSFAVLPAAESELRAGHAAAALEGFRTAYARAIFEGRPGIAERIRTRTGLAGAELLTKRPDANFTGLNSDAAWPFLEAFVLFSEDFNRDAEGVENAYLSRLALHKTRFEYRLTRADGSTFWDGQPMLDPTGLWPFWLAWMEATTKPLASGLYLEKGAPWPSASYAQVMPLYLRNQMPMPIQAHIAVAGAPGSSPGAQCLFTPPSPFGKAEPGAPGHWQIKGLLAQRGASLTRVILFTNVLPGPRSVSLTLVRDYRPL